MPRGHRLEFQVTAAHRRYLAALDGWLAVRSPRTDATREAALAALRVGLPDRPDGRTMRVRRSDLASARNVSRET